jgi:hypothetical protein
MQNHICRTVKYIYIKKKKKKYVRIFYMQNHKKQKKQKKKTQQYIYKPDKISSIAWGKKTVQY